MDGIRNVALSFFSRVQVRLDDGDEVFVVGNGNGFFNGNRFTGEVFHSSSSGKRQEKWFQVVCWLEVGLNQCGFM